MEKSGKSQGTFFSGIGGNPDSGSQLDVVTSELCFVCQTRKERGTVCERGLVHGDSGQLEVENVKKMFGRSLALG